MKNIIKPHFILVLIFIIGLVIRFYRLDQNLPEIYADEAGHYALNAQVEQHPFSLIPRIMSFTWIFGVNPLGARSASAFYSSLLVLVCYFLSLEYSKQKSAALISAFFAAILPAFFSLARIGHTHIPFIVIFSSLTIILLNRVKDLRSFSLACLPLLFATYFYFSLLVITPLYILIAAFITIKLARKHVASLFFSLGLAFLVVIGIGLRYQIFAAGSRIMSLLIVSDVNTYVVSDQKRGFILDKPFAPFIYNKVTANLDIFTKNYLSFFSPDWLFLKGDPILRHSTGMAGSLYLFMAPLLLLGLFQFINHNSRKQKLILVSWVLLAPVPAALSNDGAGYLLRAVTMLPILVYWTSLGVSQLFTYTKYSRIFALTFLVLVSTYSVARYFVEYFYVYPNLAFHSFEYGFKDLSDYQQQNNNQPFLVVWDGYYPNMLFHFWQHTPLNEYWATPKTFSIGESTFFQTAPNLYFSAIKSKSDLDLFIKNHQDVYLVLGDRYYYKYLLDLQPELSPIKEIWYPDKSSAFKIYKINSSSGLQRVQSQ